MCILGFSENPFKVAVLVVTAPVCSLAYSSWSCCSSDAQAQDEFMIGGETLNLCRAAIVEVKSQETYDDLMLRVRCM